MKKRRKGLEYGILGAVLLALCLIVVQLLGMVVWERNFAAELFSREGLPKEAEEPSLFVQPAKPSESKYGYWQLDKDERTFYDALSDNVLMIEEKTDEYGLFPIEKIELSGIILEEEDLKKVLTVYLNENPLCFWLADSFRYSHMGDSTNVYLFSYASPVKQSQMSAALKARVEVIATDARVIGKELDRELNLFHTIVENCVYSDGQNWKDFTAYGALVEGKAVCEGYSRAFQLLATESGLPCYIVNGYSGGTAHMWNVVEIDDKFYHIDVTGCDSEELVSYIYFNLSDEKISETHMVNPSFYEIDKALMHRGNLVLPSCNNMEANYYRTRAFQISSVQKKSNHKLEEFLTAAIEAGETSVSLYIAETLDFNTAVNKLLRESPYLYLNSLSDAAREAGVEMENSKVVFVADEAVRGITIKLREANS